MLSGSICLQQPAPNTLIQSLCALHVICAAKDVGIESLRAVVNHCPGAAGLRDEHMMVPLHYLCKSTSICSSFQSLQERFGRTKHRVNTNTFRLIHLLLQKFSEELCRFVHLNHPTQDPDAAEQCRQRWGDNWRTRELPPELLTQITRDSTGHLADSWRDWVCDILAPLAEPTDGPHQPARLGIVPHLTHPQCQPGSSPPSSRANLTGTSHPLHPFRTIHQPKQRAGHRKQVRATICLISSLFCRRSTRTNSTRTTHPRPSTYAV